MTTTAEPNVVLAALSTHMCFGVPHGRGENGKVRRRNKLWL